MDARVSVMDRWAGPLFNPPILYGKFGVVRPAGLRIMETSRRKMDFDSISRCGTRSQFASKRWIPVFAGMAIFQCFLRNPERR